VAINFNARTRYEYPHYMDCQPTFISAENLVFPSPSGKNEIVQRYKNRLRILSSQLGGDFYQIDCDVPLTIQWVNDISFLCYQMSGTNNYDILYIKQLSIFKLIGTKFSSIELKLPRSINFGNNVVYNHKDKSIIVMGKQNYPSPKSLRFEDPWAILDEIRTHMPILPDLVNEVIKMITR